MTVPTDSDRIGDLFHDDWRDPDDDFERTSYLLVFALGALAGLALVIASPIMAARGAGVGLFLIGTIFGLILLIPCTVFLIKEAKRANLREMTADRFVAGGIVVGFATSGLGFFMLRAAGSGSHSGHDAGGEMILILGLMLLGAAMLVFWLGVGLVCAFGGGRFTTRAICVRSVLSRYAVEPTGECAFEHPDPSGDGVQGWISFRGADGRKYDFRASPDVYARAYSAAGRTVSVQRGVAVAIGPTKDFTAARSGG